MTLGKIEKIVIAPDSFKDSLAAGLVAEAIAAGIRLVYPNIEIVATPVADGGEGTIEALVISTGGRIEDVQNITDPLGAKITSRFGVLGDGTTAIIEMAAASGLPLVPVDKRNPMNTTTYGTGEIIAEALNRGFKEIIIGVGGSATTDGGVGAAQALGIKFYDRKNNPISEPATGKDLVKISRFDLSEKHPQLDTANIMVAWDVDNTLTGDHGAARIYSPQKGASAEDVIVLEKGLVNLAGLVKRTLDREIADMPGSGAAGGLAAGLVAFCNAKLHNGAELILDAIGFEKILEDADLVITGEGAFNRQTLYGKAPLCVARRAKKRDIPVLFLTGSIEEYVPEIYSHGVTAVFSIVERPVSLEEAVNKTDENLKNSTEQIFRLFHSLQ